MKWQWLARGDPHNFLEDLKMRQTSGKIIILVNDKPKRAHRIQYGFVKAKGLGEDVFFNLASIQGAVFESLKMGAKVRVLVKQTKHGPYAERLEPSSASALAAEAELSTSP